MNARKSCTMSPEKSVRRSLFFCQFSSTFVQVTDRSASSKGLLAKTAGIVQGSGFSLDRCILLKMLYAGEKLSMHFGTESRQ
jgi:hypothetical protein